MPDFLRRFSDGEALLLGFDGARAGNEGDHERRQR